MEKQCSKCNEVKSISEFGMHRGKIGGMSQCKVCNRNRGRNYYGNNTEKEKKRCKDKFIYDSVYVSNYRTTDKYKKKLKDRYHTDPEYRFGRILLANLQGVKNRKEFKVIWDDVIEIYNFYGISYDIDHKVPKSWFLISTPKYLINHLDNLHVIDRKYNRSKLNRWSDPVQSEYLDKIRPYVKKEHLGLLKSL
tara:strand:+ start:15 stop:593 length:579 start_codon:yes stop_codon:yes gene_type:complete